MGRHETCSVMRPLIIALIAHCCLLVSSANNSNVRITIESIHQKPNLSLTIDQPTKHSKYVHQLKPNVFLVNMTGVFTLRLDCWASYPIDLRFFGHLTNLETTVKTFRKEYGTEENPKSWFIINATMETYEQITGNYTCFSVENPKIFSSSYIFVSPTPPGVLLTRGKNILLQPEPHHTKIIFPCAVSHPDVHVHLYKDEYQIQPSTWLSYDPKVGFTMMLDRSAYGNYSCRTELSSKDIVNFLLIRAKNFQVRPRMNPIRLHPNERLNVSCDATEDFIIVSIPETLPVDQNKVEYVENLPHEDQPFYKYTGTLISGHLKPKDSGYISCVWKSSNATFAQWRFSVMNNGMKVPGPGELNPGKIQSACPNTNDIVVYECSNPIECRINSCLRKDSECHSSGNICSNDKRCVHSGMIQCPSETTPVLEIFFTGFPSSSQPNKTNRYIDWKNVSHDELLLLEQVEIPIYWNDNSSKIQLSCQGSNFIFASGFRWAIHFQNGTQLAVTSLKEAIAGDLLNVTVQNTWKDKKSNLESTLTLSTSSKSISKNISFIECKAPVWDSWQWIPRRIAVNFDMPKTFRKDTSSAGSECYMLLERLLCISWFLICLIFSY